MTAPAVPEAQACENTDRELWREREGDYYAASIFVTKDGGVGINVGGAVFTMPLARWHVLAAVAEPAIDFHSDDFRKARPGDRWPRFEQPLAPAPAVAPEALATPSFANSPDSMWLPTQGGSGTSPNWFGLVKVEDIRKAMTMIEERELSASAALPPLQSALAMSQSYAIQGASVVLNFRDDAARSAFTAALVEFHQARLTAKPPAAAPDVGIEALIAELEAAARPFPDEDDLRAPLFRQAASTIRAMAKRVQEAAAPEVELEALARVIYAVSPVLFIHNDHPMPWNDAPPGIKERAREQAKAAWSSMAQRVQSAERERDEAIGASTEIAAENRMMQISKLIKMLTETKDRWGDTCVYIRQRGLSWGAVALNRRDEDEKNGIFDLKADYERDIIAKHEQCERLIASKTEAWERTQKAEAELSLVRGEVAHAIQDRDGWHRNYQGYRRDFEALYGLLGIPNSDDSGATKALVSRVKQLISLEKNHG